MDPGADGSPAPGPDPTLRVAADSRGRPFPPRVRTRSGRSPARSVLLVGLADGRADVDHVFVLRRHERRADQHDQTLDVAEELGAVVVRLHLDTEVVVRLRLEAVLAQEL